MKGQFSENCLNTANFLHVVLLCSNEDSFTILKSQHLLHSCQAFWQLYSTITVRELSTRTGKRKISLDFSFLWLLDIGLGLLMIMQLCLSFEMSTINFSTSPFEMWQYLSCETNPYLSPLSWFPLMAVQHCFEIFVTCFKGKFHSLYKVIKFKSQEVLSTSKERAQIRCAKMTPGHII